METEDSSSLVIITVGIGKSIVTVKITRLFHDANILKIHFGYSPENVVLIQGVAQLSSLWCAWRSVSQNEPSQVRSRAALD